MTSVAVPDYKRASSLFVLLIGGRGARNSKLGELNISAAREQQAVGLGPLM